MRPLSVKRMAEYKHSEFPMLTSIIRKYLLILTGVMLRH